MLTSLALRPGDWTQICAGSVARHASNTEPRRLLVSSCTHDFVYSCAYREPGFERKQHSAGWTNFRENISSHMSGNEKVIELTRKTRKCEPPAMC